METEKIVICLDTKQTEKYKIPWKYHLPFSDFHKFKFRTNKNEIEGQGFK